MSKCVDGGGERGIGHGCLTKAKFQTMLVNHFLILLLLFIINLVIFGKIIFFWLLIGTWNKFLIRQEFQERVKE